MDSAAASQWPHVCDQNKNLAFETMKTLRSVDRGCSCNSLVFVCACRYGYVCDDVPDGTQNALAEVVCRNLGRAYELVTISYSYSNNGNKY